jgi:hypothetical protein
MAKAVPKFEVVGTFLDDAAIAFCHCHKQSLLAVDVVVVHTDD